MHRRPLGSQELQAGRETGLEAVEDAALEPCSRAELLQPRPPLAGGPRAPGRFRRAGEAERCVLAPA
eukprot:459733-Lingulodinium_polyedra.AAC.1